ncbi:gas vesicle protein [Streptomyces sp. NPDC059637]|nr:gas vesicle protein [Streptomyces sp. HB2AG]MCZ2528060.1 gas vesicle protein [Streptomyces sp. HB2AG]
MAEQRERRGRPAAGSAVSSPPPVEGPEEAAGRACRCITALTGHPAEGVSAVGRSEDGWHVEVDVLEVPRIPDTTSLLATYEVELDRDGELLRYRRVRRYRRGAADD